MPVRSREIFPPGGWQFRQIEMGWDLPQEYWYRRFPDVVNKIIDQRTANPNFNLAVDFETVANELDTYTCHRIGFHPHYCTTDPLKKKLPAQPQPRAALASKPSPLARLVAGVKASASGAQILSDWLGEGGMPVPEVQAQGRADICLTCPLNDKETDWITKFTSSVAKAIKDQREIKTRLTLKVIGEDQLGTCDACLCHLPLKVHVPIKHIVNHTSEEILSKFDPRCWILKEVKKKILCVIPFYRADVRLAEKLIGWIEELGGCKGHECLLIADPKLSKVWCTHMTELAEKSFDDVTLIRSPQTTPEEGWPEAINWKHKTAREYIATHGKQSWLWLEPDSTPIVRGWLDLIQKAYDEGGKPCMGAVMKSVEPNMPKEYLAGVAVYPGDAYKLFRTDSPLAFDIANPSLVLPNTHPTSLIQHRWGTKDLPPTFRVQIQNGDPKNALTLAAISKEAVLFHRCKDGTLIDVLRESRLRKSRPGATNKIIPMIAHLDMSSGYGIFSVQMATALTKLGYQVELYPPSWNDIHGRVPDNIRSLIKQGPNKHPWNFVLFPCVFQPGNLEMKEGKDTASFSMWESARLTSPKLDLNKDFTKGVNFLNRCTVAITPCSWNASTFSSCGVDTPIRICQLGCDTSIFQLTENNVSGTLVFGTAAKTAAGGIRKGFNRVMAAFRLAFPNETDVKLKVKAFAEDPPIETDGDTRIEVLQKYITQTDLVEWYRSINVFASGSSSEGWGRHQHEAACMGRPIIGVNFGGVCEFFSYENGYPVDYNLIPAEGIYEGMGCYAGPDVNSMATQMRRCYEDRKELLDKSILAANSARRFTLDYSAKKLISILKEFSFI